MVIFKLTDRDYEHLILTNWGFYEFIFRGRPDFFQKNAPQAS